MFIFSSSLEYMTVGRRGGQALRVEELIDSLEMERAWDWGR